MQKFTASSSSNSLPPPSLRSPASLITNLADTDETAPSLGRTLLPPSQRLRLPLPRPVESVSTSLSSSSSATLDKLPEISTPTKKLAQTKSFKEVLESMIAANIAFGLENKNTPENLNIFGKLFNVTTDVTPDQIQGIIDENNKKLDAFRSKRKTDVNSRSDSRSDSREEQTSSDRKKLDFSFGSKIKDDVNAATPPRVEAGQSQKGTVATKSLFGDDAEFDTKILLKPHTGWKPTMPKPPNPNQPLFREDYPENDPKFKPAPPPGPPPPLKTDESGNIDPLGGLPVIDSKGGKRKRTIKRKHRSIRYNTLRSKK